MPLSIRPLGRTFACAVAGLALSLSAPALATPLTFTFTGAFNGSFMLDSNPVVATSTPIASGVLYTGGTGDFATTRTENAGGGPYNIAFFTDSFLPPVNSNFYSTRGVDYGTGPQLFSGTTAAPVFSTGSYAFGEYFSGQPGTLTISGGGGSRGPGAPAPEIGAGWLAGLATLAAFALTRMRLGRGRFAPA